MCSLRKCSSSVSPLSCLEKHKCRDCRKRGGGAERGGREVPGVDL